MKWILIGYLLSSLITSEHDNREACEGRAVVLREKGAIVKCVESPTNTTSYGNVVKIFPGTNTMCANTAPC